MYGSCLLPYVDVLPTGRMDKQSCDDETVMETETVDAYDSDTHKARVWVAGSEYNGGEA